MSKQEIVNEWREQLNVMGHALRDFEQALPDITTDDEFMQAYRNFSDVCGDVLDGMRLPIGGTVDDLREAVGGER